jgi:hypothetical protein
LFPRPRQRVRHPNRRALAHVVLLLRIAHGAESLRDTGSAGDIRS